MRQGHAWLLQKDPQGYDEARRCFQQAISLSDTLEVPRLKVEANWGLCQAYGFKGDPETALAAANQGIQLARAAGDEWVEACIRLSMGATFTLEGRYPEAIIWLDRAGNAFRECSDTFGQANGRLWQCLVWYHSGDTARLERDVADLLSLAQAHGYDYLFRQRTLLGPPDPRAFVPILLIARDRDIHAAYARQTLAQMGLENVQHHPGYELRVQLLGVFRVWRGRVEIDPSSWKRQKARQLFLFLLTHRHALWEREQICNALWPELAPQQAQRDFKIAYSALLNVLEPQRSRNAPSAYIHRDGSRYGWSAPADVQLDVSEFEALIKQGDAAYRQNISQAAVLYRQMLQLYQGEYLQEFPYEEWCSEERERLSALFLQTAERLAAILIQQQAWEEAIHTAQVILMYDDCWESAYRILMRAYTEQGQSGQAIRAYQRCVDRLDTVLGVAPSSITIQLFESLA
jgi:DNA-binding SARP family transcriptional activator